METYEEKYKDLVKRLNKAREEKGVYTFNSVLDAVAPELKIEESEDERIRKAIKLMYSFLPNEPTYIGDVPVKDIFAWLEKQGEQKPVEPQQDMLSQEQYAKAVDECIFGEQKPADKVEPKFKVGDWVVTSYGKVNQIVSVDKDDDDGYTLDDGTYFSGSWCDMFHLWTIQDAKDGDVLANNGNIILFKQISDSARPDYKFIQSYCFVLTHRFDFYLSGTYSLDDGFHPAIKEQRDLLFQKMKEAGYGWDAENKQLKKIEQKPAWSEEDETGWTNTMIMIKECAANHYTKDSIDLVLNWLKSLKDRYTWKPSDEQMQVLANALSLAKNCGEESTFDLRILYEQLKKL